MQYRAHLLWITSALGACSGAAQLGVDAGDATAPDGLGQGLEAGPDVSEAAGHDASVSDGDGAADVAAEAQVDAFDAGPCGDPDATMGWCGDRIECVPHDGGCGSIALKAFLCPGTCAAPPPTYLDAQPLCTDSVFIPWNGKADSSAILLWCCPLSDFQ